MDEGGGVDGRDLVNENRPGRPCSSRKHDRPPFLGPERRRRKGASAPPSTTARRERGEEARGRSRTSPLLRSIHPQPNNDFSGYSVKLNWARWHEVNNAAADSRGLLPRSPINLGGDTTAQLPRASAAFFAQSPRHATTAVGRCVGDSEQAGERATSERPPRERNTFPCLPQRRRQQQEQRRTAAVRRNVGCLQCVCASSFGLTRWTTRLLKPLSLSIIQRRTRGSVFLARNFKKCGETDTSQRDAGKSRTVKTAQPYF